MFLHDVRGLSSSADAARIAAWRQPLRAFQADARVTCFDVRSSADGPLHSVLLHELSCVHPPISINQSFYSRYVVCS